MVGSYCSSLPETTETMPTHKTCESQAWFSDTFSPQFVIVDCRYGGNVEDGELEGLYQGVVYSHKKASQTFLYFVLTVLTQCRLPRNKMHSALHGNVMILPLTLLSTSNASVHRLSKDFKFPCSWLSCTYFRHPKHHFVTFWF